MLFYNIKYLDSLITKISKIFQQTHYAYLWRRKCDTYIKLTKISPNEATEQKLQKKLLYSSYSHLSKTLKIFVSYALSVILPFFFPKNSEEFWDQMVPWADIFPRLNMYTPDGCLLAACFQLQVFLVQGPHSSHHSLTLLKRQQLGAR